MFAFIFTSRPLTLARVLALQTLYLTIWTTRRASNANAKAAPKLRVTVLRFPPLHGLDFRLSVPSGMLLFSQVRNEPFSRLTIDDLRLLFDIRVRYERDSSLVQWYSKGYPSLCHFTLFLHVRLREGYKKKRRGICKDGIHPSRCDIPLLSFRSLQLRAVASLPPFS